MKDCIKTILELVVIIGVFALLSMKATEISNERRDKEVQEYKACILEQSETQGWILRSACSLNYEYLDNAAGLEYTQSGYDLYLKR